MNNLNLSQDNFNALLQMAGKKLGKDPEELKAQLESGNVDNLTRGLDAKSAKQLNSVLSNPKLLEAMMNSDQVKKLLSGLAGGQK